MFIKGLRNFVNKVSVGNYKKWQMLKLWIVVVVFAALSLIGELSFTLIFLDIAAIALMIACTVIYREQEKSKLFLVAALFSLVFAFLMTSCFLRLALWMEIPDMLFLLIPIIMAWIIIIPITYGVVQLLLKTGYYGKKRNSRLEAIGATGGSGIGLIIAYSFGPTAAIILVLFVGTTVLVSIATTCAMRYKYVMKYNLESSMKTVGDKFEKEK